MTRDLTERAPPEQERLRLAQAEEAIRLRDEFLSHRLARAEDAAHALQLQLDSLRDRTRTSADQQVATKLQRAAQSSERLADLVESLLDVSRIATGRFALALQEFDMAELCRAPRATACALAANKARC